MTKALHSFPFTKAQTHMMMCDLPSYDITDYEGVPVQLVVGPSVLRYGDNSRGHYETPNPIWPMYTVSELPGEYTEGLKSGTDQSSKDNGEDDDEEGDGKEDHIEEDDGEDSQEEQ